MQVELNVSKLIINARLKIAGKEKQEEYKTERQKIRSSDKKTEFEERIKTMF